MTSQENKYDIHDRETDNLEDLLGYIPQPLQSAIASAVENRYEELYESDSDGSVLLEDTLNEILQSFQDKHPAIGQLRYVWMALTFAIVVEPTVRYYQPDNTFPKETIDRLTNWLLITVAKNSGFKLQSNGGNKNLESTISPEDRSGASPQNIPNLQIILEALDVYDNAIKTIEPSQDYREALLNILDDCLEGYAIFPGSAGRRELLNWWLLEVVPSSWWLRPPKSLYSPNISESVNNSDLARQLRISNLIWTLIMKTQRQEKKGKKVMQVDSNYYSFTGDSNDNSNYNYQENSILQDYRIYDDKVYYF
jgi:hypothetical protein